MADQASVDIQCPSCGGSGVYRGFAEPEGVGVVCLDCNGTGKKALKYFPFTGRTRRTGIRIVRRSRGSLLPTGLGPTGPSVTYAEFLSGKMPGDF